jgi:hypothetical protein
MIGAGSSGKTSTSYVETGLQGTNRPSDKRSVVEAIEFIGREDTPLLSKLSTGQKATNNRHGWLQRKVSEADRKPVAEVSGFTGGTKPSTQRLDNATEIFKHEDFISQAAKDTVTYGASEQSLLDRDLVLKHKKTMEQAILGIGRTVITGTSNYVYTPLDADPAIAAKMSLISAPKFRSGDGTNAADASQMAGIFHYLANTGKLQSEIDSGSFRDLQDWTDKWLGNIKTFDSAGDMSGTKTTIDRKHIHELIRKMTDYGVKPINGAFDLYCGGDLLETITDMYKDNRRTTMTDKEIGYQVETIITPFGKARIQYHQDFNSANGLDDVLLVGNFSYAQKSYLTDTYKSNPSSDATADLVRYYSDMTLAVRNAFAFAAGFGLKA